ncbi:hypothetical protein VNO80_04692 [Phaseolus coccineus]|uniref:Uncharacterized protein n=1 Tax=Phaseolus coccineus TaxID=3886 RepID=A0AAN9NYC0_PHACN
MDVFCVCFERIKPRRMDGGERGIVVTGVCPALSQDAERRKVKRPKSPREHFKMTQTVRFFPRSSKPKSSLTLKP